MKKGNLMWDNLGTIVLIVVGLLIGAIVIWSLFNSGAFNLNLPF